MADITIIRGDSYSLRRPLFTYSFVTNLGAAFDLAGCVIRTTYKPNVLGPADDPVDATAAIKHTLRVGSDGISTETDGIYLSGLATLGVVVERMTATETRTLPAGIALVSDLELTDANGEVFTWLFSDWLQNKDGVTNRTT